MGKAWPGSPKAPSSTRTALPRELGDEAQLFDALVGGERRGRDPEGAHARVAVDGQALAHDIGRTAQRHRVDELVGDRCHGLVALAFQIEVLDPARVRLEAVAADELVVEVLL